MTTDQPADELAAKLKRTEVQHRPSSIPGREIVVVLTEIPCGVESGWHIHPGEEIGYILAGTVVQSQRTASTLYFRVRDPKRDISVPVSYQGSIPGPFAVGRGVLVSVRKTASGVYVGQPGSLTTKCPSKYQAVAAGTSN